MASPPYNYSQSSSRFGSPDSSHWSGDSHLGNPTSLTSYGSYGSPENLPVGLYSYGSPSVPSMIRDPSTPPTSSSLSQDEDFNGRALRSARPAKRRARSSSRARSGTAKDKANVPELAAPLSVLTQDMHDVPLKDIEALVNRSTKERLLEAEVAGKVKRPMNSFMLYRTAYADRTKRWCVQNNHQIVSMVIGESWAMEPQSIRDMYAQFAQVERDNHHLAHPDYKFNPCKATKQAEHDNAINSDANTYLPDDNSYDPGYSPSGSTKRSRRSAASMGRTVSSYGVRDSMHSRSQESVPLVIRSRSHQEPHYSGQFAELHSDLQAGPLQRSYGSSASLYDELKTSRPVEQLAEVSFPYQPQTHTQYQDVPFHPIVELPGTSHPELTDGNVMPGTGMAFDPSLVDPTLLDDSHENITGPTFMIQIPTFSDEIFHDLGQENRLFTASPFIQAAGQPWESNQAEVDAQEGLTPDGFSYGWRN